MKIGIIGAGIAGLTIANEIKNKHNITVFEKSRGFGGRLSTRYADPFYFDHGCPYFEAKTPVFQEFCTKLEEQSILTKWQPREVEITQNITKELVKSNYYTGNPKMNDIGKFLAQGLDVLQSEVSRVEYKNNQWNIFDKEHKTYSGYDFIIFAIPPKQIRNILSQELWCTNLQNAQMQGVFSLMLGIDDDSSLNFDVGHCESALIERIIVNSKKPNRNQAASVVVFSSSKWAEDNMENDINANMEVLQQEFFRITGIDASNLKHSAIHRWRYAFCQNPLEKPIIQKHFASCGDWAHPKANVEGAFLSAKEVINFINSQG